MGNVYLIYFLILITGCLEYFFHYKLITTNKDVSKKQKGCILSLKNSLTLVFAGIYFNYYYIVSGFDNTKFINMFTNPNELNIGIILILYFTSYLIVDVYIGITEYPDSMKKISGNFHHICYIAINTISLYFGFYPVYLLHMLSEIPTFILSLGSTFLKFRSDNLFGTMFFFTRIVYHIILTFIFRNYSIVFYISLAALSLHIYWFYNWCKKYFFHKPPKKINKNKNILKNKNKNILKNKNKNKNILKNKKKNILKNIIH